MVIYTGIGSRNAPDKILNICTEIGKTLAEQNFILRSGGANGCDTAFEIGCNKANGSKEIYLPWKSFNSNTSNLYNIPSQAYDTVKKFHPNPSSLKNGAIKLIARDSQQVLGQYLDKPSDMVIYYAEVDKHNNIIGGTGQAIRIAKYYKIPTLNILDVYELNLINILNIIKRLK